MDVSISLFLFKGCQVVDGGVPPEGVVIVDNPVLDVMFDVA
jgi:hypothetical protein